MTSHRRIPSASKRLFDKPQTSNARAEHSVQSYASERRRSVTVLQDYLVGAPSRPPRYRQQLPASAVDGAGSSSNRNSPKSAQIPSKAESKRDLPSLIAEDPSTSPIIRYRPGGCDTPTPPRPDTAALLSSPKASAAHSPAAFGLLELLPGAGYSTGNPDGAAARSRGTTRPRKHSAEDMPASSSSPRAAAPDYGETRGRSPLAVESLRPRHFMARRLRRPGDSAIRSPWPTVTAP